MRRNIIIAVLTIAAIWLGLVAACNEDPTGIPAALEDYVVLVGTGDISDCVSDDDEETASLLDTIEGTVFTTGDNVYPDGTAEEFEECYEPTWGRHKARTYPTPGNHDYNTEDASAYFAYFGERAGEPGKGYYSYELGEWHIIALNSNIDTSVDSEQLAWLEEELENSDAFCTLAYWHHPLFTSGEHGRIESVRPFWTALEDAGADVILNGHDHHYERFAPQTSDGRRDTRRGIRQFIVGTGGRSLRGEMRSSANSEFHYTDGYGVLKLQLYAEHYAWRYIGTGGKVIDRGIGFCH